jgi:hypothetical protein
VVVVGLVVGLVLGFRVLVNVWRMMLDVIKKSASGEATEKGLGFEFRG